jgi:GTP cyclohydrolase II
MLGLPADARTYEMCKPMLNHVGVNKVKLITNNPNKINYLTDLGIEVVERVPLLVGVNEYNSEYLQTKKDKMGHLITEVAPVIHEQ